MGLPMKTDLMNPLVTIVIPVFNSEKTIQETLSSVIGQTYGQWQALIVADRGTTDSTEEVVKKIADPRLKYVYLSEARGLSDCRNYGIDHAAGELVAFLDSDDIWSPEKLQRQIDALQGNDFGLCVTGFHRFDDITGKQISKNTPKEKFNSEDLFKNNFIGCSTAMVNKNKIGQVRFKNMHQEDFVFWLEILNQGISGIGIKDDLVGYRVLPNSRSSRVNRPFNRWKIMRQHFGLSFLKSFYYFSNYALTAILKRFEI